MFAWNPNGSVISTAAVPRLPPRGPSCSPATRMWKDCVLALADWSGELRLIEREMAEEEKKNAANPGTGGDGGVEPVS